MIPELGLESTPARHAFKQNAGQNNHFLVTLLVGLDGIRAGQVTLNPEFSTSWGPKDPRRSAERSREYALKTSLVWIVDLVDAYRRGLSATTGVVDASTAQHIQALDGRSLRLRELSKVLGIQEHPAELLARLAIHWRNRVVHSDSHGKLDARIRAELIGAAGHLAETHRGLDIRASLARMKGGAAPRFKEVTSLIAAAHTTVKLLDDAALSRIDLAAYADQVIKTYLNERAEAGDAAAYEKLWPGSPEKTTSRLTRLLMQHGMRTGDAVPRKLDVNYLTEASQLTVREARQRFASSTQRV